MEEVSGLWKTPVLMSIFLMPCSSEVWPLQKVISTAGKQSWRPHSWSWGLCLSGGPKVTGDKTRHKAEVPGLHDTLL